MICEFQLAASDFLITMKNKVANAGICLASAALPLPGADPLYLDHLELGNAQFVSASRAALDFVAVVVSQSVLATVGAGALSPFLTTRVSGTMLLDLSMDSTTAGGPFFKTTYAGLTNVVDPVAGAALNTALLAAPGLTQSIPLDTSKIAKLLDLVGVVPRAGVARDVTGVALAIRLDFAPDFMNLGPWFSFLTGNFPVRINPAAGENFASFLDVDAATHPITQSMLDHAFKGKTHLDSALTPAWSPAAGGADARYDFTIKEVDACSLGPFSNDISADVTLTVSFRMPMAPAMVTSGSLDWDVSDWDVIVCALKTFGIGVILGAFSEALFNPAGEWLSEAQLGLAGFVAPILIASNYTPDLSKSFKSKPNCSIAGDQKSFTCTSDLSAPSILGPAAITRLVGMPDGLTILGRTSVNLVALPILDSVTLTPFTFDVRGNCTAGFSVQDDASANVNFVTQTAGAAIGAVTLCSIVILDAAAAGSYQITTGLVGEVTQFIVQAIGAPAMGCRVLFLSNGGVRILDFGIPPVLGEEQSKLLNIVAGAETVNCKRQIGGWHGIPGLFDPHWLIDPGDFRVDPQAHDGREQIWQFVVTELEAGSAITLHAPDGGQVGEAIAGANGAVELAAATALPMRQPGTASQPGVQLRRAGSGNRPGTVFYRQTLLQKQSEIALRFAAERVGLTAIGGRAAVLVRGAGGEVAAYRIAHPAFPQFLGGDGPVQASGYAGLDQSAAYGDVVFAIVGGRVEIRGSSESEVRHIDAPNASAVFALSGGLAVRDSRGLSILSLEHGGNPHLVRTIPLAAGVPVCRAVGASGRDALFVGTPGGGGEILSFGNLEKSTVLARYASRPWFVGAARMGNIVAHPARGRGDVLEIFDASRTGYFQLSASAG